MRSAILLLSLLGASSTWAASDGACQLRPPITGYCMVTHPGNCWLYEQQASTHLPSISVPSTTCCLAPPLAPPAVLCQTYVVQSGDTVWGIASKFGVLQDDLVAALTQCIGFTAGGTLAVGQKICLPGYVPACDSVIDSGK